MSIRGNRWQSVAGMFCLFLGLGVERLDASPIELSTVLDGVSLAGTSNDSTLAPDCLPGQVCLPLRERAFNLQIDESELDLEMVLIPDLEPDLAAKLKEIDDDGSLSAAEKEQARFALLKEATLGAGVDKELPGFVVKVPTLPSEKVAKFNSSLLLKPGSKEYFEYIGNVGFKEGYKPGGAAIIIYKPGTEEGRALIIPGAVPEPAGLALLGVGVAGLLVKSRRKSRACGDGARRLSQA